MDVLGAPLKDLIFVADMNMDLDIVRIMARAQQLEGGQRSREVDRKREQSKRAG